MKHLTDNRADAIAQANAELLDEVATPYPALPSPAVDHRLEVILRIDGIERTFTAVCLRGEWIGHSTRLITGAIK